MSARIANSLSKRLQKNIKKTPEMLQMLMFNDKTIEALSAETEKTTTINPRIRNDINSLKLTANSLHICSLSGNQCLLDYKTFVISKNLVNNLWISKEVYKETEQFKGYINPEIIAVSKEIDEQWEMCPAIPMIKAWVKRYKGIKVRYMNEDQDEVEEELEGFPARVFQHENDHQQGLTFLDWRVSEANLEFIPEAENDFPRLSKILKEYKDKVVKLKKDFPSLFNYDAQQKLDGAENWYILNDKSRETVSFEKDLINSISKAITRDTYVLMEKYKEELVEDSSKKN